MFLREVNVAIRSSIALWVLTALIYPALLLLIGLIFPYQANGSLLTNAQGQVVGSALIGQPFSSEKYFWSRPSTSAYSTAPNGKDASGKPLDTAGILKTGVSGASNLAPSNSALLERIQGKSDPDPSKAITGDLTKLKSAGFTTLTADMVYTSGSSLDPHITPEAALAQVDRIAKVRSLSPDQIQSLITQNTDGRFLGIFGEPGVNVLKLNLALDVLKPIS